MIAPSNMSAKQVDWIARMRANLETLHNQWYGWDANGQRRMDQELFAETDRKIREAARRCNVVVENGQELSDENEGWDGELNGDLVVLGMALDTIIAARRR
jgi:hypothetical protein